MTARGKSERDAEEGTVYQRDTVQPSFVPLYDGDAQTFLTWGRLEQSIDP